MKLLCLLFMFCPLLAFCQHRDDSPWTTKAGTFAVGDTIKFLKGSGPNGSFRDVKKDSLISGSVTRTSCNKDFENKKLVIQHFSVVKTRQIKACWAVLDTALNLEVRLSYAILDHEITLVKKTR